MTTMLTTETTPRDQGLADTLKGWVMMALTLAFIALYAAALLGWLKPLPDEKMVTRIEPMIFVIVGYYFGRLPAQHGEKTLRNEITRQTQKADASQHAKERAQQAREALEEKVKNARTALLAAGTGAPSKGVSPGVENAGSAARDETLRAAVAAAVGILNS